MGKEEAQTESKNGVFEMVYKEKIFESRTTAGTPTWYKLNGYQG